MKKEKTVRTYQRRTKSGKMVTVREHKASYDAAEEARKAAAKKAGAGSELSKKKAAVEENPLGFSADDYKEWYHWDMEDDANNEAALRVEKALIKKMGKRAYNKYLEDMSNSYSARGHKKAHQALLDEYTAKQKKQDAESVKTAKDIARGVKEKAAEAKTSKTKSSSKKKTKDSDLVEHYDQFNKKYMGKAVGDSFTFSEGSGKDKVTYDARFVTDGMGRYGYVVRDKAEGPSAKYYVGISDGYDSHRQLPAGLRKAAEAQGLTFKGGEFVKKETKGDRVVARKAGVSSYNESIKKAESDWMSGAGHDKKLAWDKLIYHIAQKQLAGFKLTQKQAYYYGLDKTGRQDKKAKTQSSTTYTTGAGADWSKATVDKVGREYGGGYTIVGTPNDSLWSSTNFRTKSQALAFIKRKQKESSAKSEKEEPKSRRSSTSEKSGSYATLKKFEGAPYRMRISRNGDPMPGEKQKLAKWKAGHRKLKEYLSTPEGAADKKSYVAKQKEKERKAEEKRKRDVAKWREKYTAEKKAKKEKFDAKVSELKGKGFKAKKRVTTKYTSYLKGVNTVLDCFVSPDKKSAYVYRSGEESPTLRKATAKELKIIIGEAKAKKPTKMH